MCMVLNVYDILVDASYGVIVEVYVYLITRVDYLICAFIGV